MDLVSNMSSLSLEDIKNALSVMKSSGANGDYTPPSMQWYSDSVIYIPDGVYFKSGPRANQQYTDLDNATDFWVLEEPLFFNIDDSSFNGTTGSGFLTGGKSLDSWYGVWLVDVGGEPHPVLLPFCDVDSFYNPGNYTSVTVSPFPTTSTGILMDYRIISYTNYLWEISDQKILPIAGSTSADVIMEGGQAAPFHGRWAPAYAQSDESAWFFGGSDQSGNFYNDLWRFDFSTEQFFRIGTTGGPPTGADKASMCYDSVTNSIYLWAGYGGSYLTQGWKCTLGDNNTGVWSSITAGSNECFSYAYDPSRRRMWVYAPFNGSLTDDLWYIDIPGTGAWATASTACLPGNKRAMSMIYDPDQDCLIVYGGYNSSTTYYNQIYKYDIAGNSWSQISPTLGNNTRFWARATYLGGKMYVVGGQNGEGQGTDSLLALDLSAGEWEHLARYNSSTIRGGGIAVDTTRSGIYHFHGYDDWCTNRVPENWKYLVEEDVWKRVNGGADISTSSKLLLCPPEGTGCLYLGCVYVESDGGIRQFLKDGWSYTWYDLGASDKYRVNGTASQTGFGNTDISSVVPPTAYEIKMTPMIGDSSAMHNQRIGFVGNDAGGYLSAGFDCPMSNDRSNDNYRGPVNLCLSWYQEYYSGWQRYSQTVDYMLTCRQLLRTHFWGHDTTPDYIGIAIAGFKE